MKRGALNVLALATLGAGSLALAAAPAQAPAPAQAAGCSAQQDQQAAQAVARVEAQRRLGGSLGPLKVLYTNVTYTVDVQDAKVSGNTASVVGIVTLRGNKRFGGQAAEGKYPGTVYLKRGANCTWVYSNYKRN